MKTTTKSQKIAAAGFGLLFFALFTLKAQAGPLPQYWQSLREPKVPAAEQAKPADTPAMVCSACKTSLVSESKRVAPAGKSTVVWSTVGSQHICRMCGGAIAIVHSKTTNDMMANCPICAKAAPSCCNVNGQTLAAN